MVISQNKGHFLGDPIISILGSMLGFPGFGKYNIGA